MKRNMFGHPRPADFDELTEAMDERGYDPSQCSVMIDYEEAGDEWFAEIIDGETGSSFTTLGFTDVDNLKKDLKAVGFTDVASF